MNLLNTSKEYCSLFKKEKTVALLKTPKAIYLCSDFNVSVKDKSDYIAYWVQCNFLQLKVLHCRNYDNTLTLIIKPLPLCY